jgi:tetratricopeptide (TPR) repeat protein
VPGLTRAAHLRELFGEHAGAVELMDMAYRRTAESEVEDRAWILTDIAHLSLLTCRTDAAEKLLQDALALYPEYHYALARLAEVRAQQGREADVVDLLRRHVAAAPHPENLFGLGLALQRAGKPDEAREAFTRFEAEARAEMDGWDNANIELLYYYADVAERPEEALTIGRREAARRQDIRSLEALAWALHKNGQSKEALTTIDRALQVGVRDARTFYHAGAIAAGAGASVLAVKYLEQSAATCGASEAASEARQLLTRLQASVQ